MMNDPEIDSLILLLAMSGLFLALAITTALVEALMEIWEKYRAQR